MDENGWQLCWSELQNRPGSVGIRAGIDQYHPVIINGATRLLDRVDCSVGVHSGPVVLKPLDFWML